MNKNVQELVEKKEKETYWRTMREYLLIMWDGMGFFGCDDTKLDRLKGEKVEFRTKFKSKKWVTYNLTLLTIVVYVLNQELSKLGTQKA